MQDNTAVNTGGSIFTSLLAVLFIGLKLTGQIDWSWWWVLSPIWIPVVFAVIMLCIVGLIVAFKK